MMDKLHKTIRAETTLKEKLDLEKKHNIEYMQEATEIAIKNRLKSELKGKTHIFNNE